MLYQKVYTFLALVALSSGLALSQEALPVQGSGLKNVPEEQRLETEADSAESRLSTAIINLEKFEQSSADQSNPLQYSHRHLELKAELARADFTLSQARLAELKSQFQAAGSSQNKKKPSQNKDTVSANDIAKANEEALRKGKIAVEATTLAQAAYKDLKAAEAKEFPTPAQAQEEERQREANLSPAGRMALAIRAEAEKSRANAHAAILEKDQQAQISEEDAEQRAAELELARRAKANQEAFEEAFRLARQAAEQKRKAAAEAAQLAQEALAKAQAEEQALNAEKSDDPTLEAKKPMTVEEALEQAMAQQEAIEAEKAKQQEAQAKKSVRKVVYTGTLFTIVRDDPVQTTAESEVTTAAR